MIRLRADPLPRNGQYQLFAENRAISVCNAWHLIFVEFVSNVRKIDVKRGQNPQFQYFFTAI